jgi:acetyl-CoA acetyltransferase
MTARANRVRGQVIVAGVGYSEIGRKTGRSEGSLALEAVRNALQDSGLERDDVDGLAVWPDRISSVFEGPSITYMHRALGLKRTRYWQAFGTGPAQLSSIVGAAYAIVSGAASVVVCYRAHLRQEQRFYTPGWSGDSNPHAAGELAFRAPYGVPAGTPRYALWAQRHAYEYGTTDEHRGALVLTCREHAQLNPRAVWNGHPLTMDDYLASDVISSPLRILDCDMPVDGAVAVILASSEYLPRLRNKGVRIESLGHATGPTLETELWPDMTEMASKYASEEMWAGTELKPTDLDVAEIYDGFSTLAICWLEDAGIVDKGDAGPWLAEGRGRLGAELPICTDGGQLGAGRLHGFGKVAEAVQQLRGDCGERQVPDAQVALVCAGGGTVATAMLLTAT